MGLGFGSEQHEPSAGYACGAHLAFVRADGTLIKCGFYPEWTGGPVGEGMGKAWRRLPKPRLDDLECDCDFLEEVCGGCRFMAETAVGRLDPDLLKCGIRQI